MSTEGPQPADALAEDACRVLQEHWSAGRRVPVEHFLLARPELTAAPEAVLELVLLEVALREEAGEAPALAELEARFPALAGPMRLQAEFRDGLRQTVAAPQPGPRPPGDESLVSGYEILREIGRGGMGTVYEARQLGLNRRVALKMIGGGPLLADRDVVRLTTEAEAVSRLQHPNIVQIYEFGVHRGQPFLALELLEDGTLADRLRAGSLAPRAAAELIGTLARAVHAVHERGIVHRDLKPANVLFTPPTEGAPLGVPKLTDFGLAKLLDGGGSPTRTGETLGTPAYMAPEQVTGGKGIGPRTDVYGLGAILYEALTGRAPFSGKTIAETLLRVERSDPPPLSLLGAIVPRDLQTICLKCLEKSPARRYSSAAALADDLQRFLRGELVQARPLGALGRVGKRVRRSPLTAALTGSVLVAVVAGMIGVLVQWQSAEQARGELQDALAAEGRQRAEAELRLYYGRISQSILLWDSGDVDQARDLLASCTPAPGQDDPRGWEWFHLDRRFHPELAVHRCAFWVNDLALLPPDPGEPVKLLGAIGRPLWHDRDTPNTTDGRAAVLHPLDANDSGAFDVPLPGGVTAVAVQPGGELVAWGTTSRHIVLVDRRTRRHVRTFPTASIVNRLVFTANGQLIGGCYNGSVFVWNARTGEVARQLDAGLKGHIVLALNPSGTRLACGSDDGGVRVYELPSCDRLEVPPTFAARVTSLAYAPSGNALAAGCTDGTVVLWDAATNAELRRWNEHSGPVYAVAFHPQGHQLATGGSDRVIRIWKMEAHRAVRELRGHSAAVRTLVFAPDGGWVASGAQDSTVRVHDLSNDPVALRLPFHENLNALAFCETLAGLTVRADRLDGRVKSWALPSGTAIADVPVPAHGQPPYPVRYADFLGGGRVVASLSLRDARRLDFTDAETGQPAGAPLTTKHPIATLAADPSGAWLAWAELVNEDEVAVYWREFATGVDHGPVTLPAKRVRALAPDPVRARIAVIAVGAREGRVPDRAIVIDATGRVGPVEVARGSPMFGGLAFSPADGTLAVAVDGRTHLYDPNSWRFRSSFACAESTTCLSFTPDGRRLATVGYDGVVHLAATASGTRILQLRGPASARPGDLACDARVRFSSDGSWLAASNWDGSLTLWPTQTRGQAAGR